MKKLTSIFAALIIYFSASAFTIAETEVSSNIKTVFEKDFSSVSELKWSKSEDLYVATFKAKNAYLTAAYNDAGELLCVTRFVGPSQLPLNVTRALEAKYPDYAIDPSIVEASSNDTSYLINAENEKYKVQIKSDAAGGLTVLNKTKK